MTDTAPRDRGAALQRQGARWPCHGPAKKSGGCGTRPANPTYELRQHPGRRRLNVMLLEKGPLSPPRAMRSARFVAASTKQDLLRTGWTEDAAGERGGV
jgi:hypothetical protein